jgi:hypothetical protein
MNSLEKDELASFNKFYDESKPPSNVVRLVRVKDKETGKITLEQPPMSTLREIARSNGGDVWVERLPLKHTPAEGAMFMHDAVH